MLADAIVPRPPCCRTLALVIAFVFLPALRLQRVGPHSASKVKLAAFFPGAKLQTLAIVSSRSFLCGAIRPRVEFLLIELYLRLERRTRVGSVIFQVVSYANSGRIVSMSTATTAVLSFAARVIV